MSEQSKSKNKSLPPDPEDQELLDVDEIIRHIKEATIPEEEILKKETLYILSAPPGSGKTTYLCELAIDKVKEGYRVVYVAPKYEQLEEFAKKIREIMEDKKVKIKIVKIAGKTRHCKLLTQGIRKMNCRKCNYRDVKKYKTHDDGIIDEQSIVRRNGRICPYFALRKEARDAHIILTTYHNFIEEYKTREGKLFPNPEKTILIFDEAHEVVENLRLKHFRLMQFKCDSIRWFPKLEDIVVDLLEQKVLNKLHDIGAVHIERMVRCLGNVLRSIYNDLRTGKDLKPHGKIEWEELENTANYVANKLRQALKEIRSLGIYFEEEENIVKEALMELHRDGVIKTDPYILMEFLKSLSLARKIKVVGEPNVPRFLSLRFDIYLIPLPVPKISDAYLLKSIIQRYSQAILSSGSLTREDYELLKSHYKLKFLPFKPRITHEYVKVMPIRGLARAVDYTNGRFPVEIILLITFLYASGYITYVIHSSKDKAEKFMKVLAKHGIDSRMPETMEELYEALDEGIRIFHLVEGSPMSQNLRLPGSVVIVLSHIVKDPRYYHAPWLLLKHSVIKYTFQAMGRILNGEGRPVVWIIDEEVYNVLLRRKIFRKMKIKPDFPIDLQHLPTYLYQIKRHLGQPRYTKPANSEPDVSITLRCKTAKKKYRYPEIVIRVKNPDKLDELKITLEASHTDEDGRKHRKIIEKRFSREDLAS